MGKMRTMQHNSRANSAGRVHGSKHNDRNFDTELADNIDSAKSAGNEYWHLYQTDDPGMTFEAAELKFYVEKFGTQLQKTNDNYLAQGHPERCRDMESWKKVRQNAPEETTMQIGKMEQYADAATLIACFKDYNQRLESWNQAHGNPFTQISYALHVDEAVPHIQSRRVWHYEDPKTGIVRPGQEKALEKAGVQLPDPAKEEGRRNNRKMAFDEMCRNLWLDVLHEHGLEIEREPVPDGRHNREKEDMIREKYEDLLRETEQLKAENRELKAEVEPLRELKASLDEVTDAGRSMPGFVAVKKEKWETIEEQARAYRVNAPEIEKLRDREKSCEDWEARNRAKEYDVNCFLQQAAERQRQANAAYEKQKELNKRYTELEQRNRDLEKQLSERTKECKNLSSENVSLRATIADIPRRIDEATKSLKEQLDTARGQVEALRGRLRDAFTVVMNVVKSLGVLKYGKQGGDFRIDGLTERQGKLIDSIADYAAAEARGHGFAEMAHEMENKVGISDGVWDLVNPPVQTKKKDELVL